MIENAAPLADALHAAYDVKDRRLVAGHDPGVIAALEGVFGIPITGERVRRVTINAEVGEALTATVESFVGLDEIEATTSAKQYRFKAVPG
jgi:hypothetical protein